MTLSMDDITAIEVYAAADATYANCIICSVNPTGRCEICDDRICPQHTKRLLERQCPLCYAINLVWQRRRIISVLRELSLGNGKSG